MNNDEKQKKIDDIDTFEELEAFLSKKLKSRAKAANSASNPTPNYNSTPAPKLNPNANPNVNSNINPGINPSSGFNSNANFISNAGVADNYGNPDRIGRPDRAGRPNRANRTGRSNRPNRTDVNNINNINSINASNITNMPASRVNAPYADNDINKTRVSDAVRPANITEINGAASTSINQQNKLPGNESGQSKNIVIDAKIREGFQQERSEIFNRLEKEAGNNTRGRRNANKRNDGSYHYLGKDIKSNRQKLVDVQPPGSSEESRIDYDEEDVIVESKSKSKNRNKNKNAQSDGEVERDGFFLSGVMKAVLYIVGVISVSIILAYNIISIANDVFAFVKDSFSIEIVIPEGAELSDVTDILHDSGLIKYPRIFEFYIKYRKTDSGFVAGEYTVWSTMNYDEFVGKLRKRTDGLQTIRITIPEGYTIDQIIDVFVRNGIGTRSGFEEMINTNDFSHNGYKFFKLLNETELSPDRKYKLEGYLFPDTYEFYKSASEVDVLTKFLNNFDNKFKEEFYARCEALGMTLDDVINLASIIEREAKNPEDFPIVSSVFHNRLLHKASFPRLESNATLHYSLGEHSSDFLYMSQAERDLDVPYNTYKYDGLPPSAICNPGYEAIFAALYPDVTNYFYFVSKSDGSMLYAETYNEHLANTNEALAN